MTGKKGFRRIENELFKAIISADITRSGYKILLTVIHFTLGYQKDTADISLSTYQKMTGLTKANVLEAIRKLENKKIIRVVRDSTRKSFYQLNTNVNQWQTSIVHDTSSGIKNTSKTIPVKSQNNTKTSIVHDTKTGIVPIASTKYTKEIRNKKTLKDKVEGKGTGITISFESSNDSLDGDGAVNSSGAKPIKETVSTDDKIQPVPVFTQQNRDKFLKYQAWQTMAEGILGMSLEKAESILDRHIDDIHDREDLLEIKKQIEATLPL
jgi:phage replication O-like protein O